MLKIKFGLLIIFWSLGQALPLNAEESASSPIDIVLDIDGSLVDDLGPLTFDKGRDIAIGHRHYRLSYGTREALNRLLAFKRVRISIYSGAEAQRNIALAKIIMVTSYPPASLWNLSYKILSKPDLVDLFPGQNLPAGWRPGQRFRKDLRKINENLKNVVLLDDWDDFTLPEQTNNILHLGRAYLPFSTYADAQNWIHADTDFASRVAPSEVEWRRHYYKIHWATEVLVKALRHLEQYPTESFAEAMRRFKSQVPLPAPRCTL